MLPVIQIGPLALPAPGLAIIAGIWIGLTVSEHYARRFNVDPSHLYNLVFIALIAGIIGARLSYAVRFPAAFAASPLSLLSRDLNLLDPWGGIAVAGLAALVYGQRKGLDFWSTMDALTPGLAVLAVAWGVANLASGNAYGAPTQLPWGIQLWGAHRHPTQIYQILLALLILVVILPGTGFIRTKLSGSRFLIFVALSAGARLFLESFRGDSTLILGGIRLAQVLAWLVLAGSLWGLARLQTQRANDQPEPDRGNAQVNRPSGA
jgi:phosphatidylglycerol:prolipoprotein diacylglycerol transferase